MPTATLKLVPIGAFLPAGAVVAFWRVKMLTPEQMIMVRLRGLTRIAAKDGKKRRKDKIGSVVERPEESAFEIEADNPESFTRFLLQGSGRGRRRRGRSRSTRTGCREQEPKR
jgi:hypothetical protein